MKKILIYASFVMILLGMQIGRRNNDLTFQVAGTSDLKNQILAYIDENEQAPIEPRLDRIWHFVPGLAGIEFDFELSYQNMLSNGYFDKNLMVANTTPFQNETSELRAHRIYRGNEKSPYVSLFINVAWGGEELLEMLDILDEMNIRASIFFEGKYAMNNPDLVQTAFTRGHIIGNHSYSHPAGWLNLSYDGFTHEIARTNEILSGIIGEEIIWFAPPGGAFNDTMVQASFDQGMYTLMWTTDSIDWRGERASILTDRVLSRIVPGGLILTHPKPETVKALPKIIEGIRNLGLEFRTIDEIVYGLRNFEQ